MATLPLIGRAQMHGERIAFRLPEQLFAYSDLLGRSSAIAHSLLGEKEDLAEGRIAFLQPAGFQYTCTQWAIWQAGGVAVPLSLSATTPELEYTLADCEASQVVACRSESPKIEDICQRRGLRLLIIEDVAATDTDAPFPTVDLSRRAMILYTSGTTSKPKGVVTTHANIEAQIRMLIEAWQWQSDDKIPLFLPLHHVHGIINVMSCALWSGATIEPFAQFDIPTILNRVSEKAYTVFMAVPTIYVKMIQTLEAMKPAEREPVVDAFAGMRLMVSGSAALPASVHENWTALTGQRLLERYGMTEIGMALSNPFGGDRRPGMVGQPLPTVEIRLKADDGQIVQDENQPGEIQIKGPAVFGEYWNRPDVTRESFDDGWFRSGDVAVVEEGYYRIMGRQSIDIIKSGGYKLSALEIEASLLEHPSIRECAVVGIADDTWGEAVAVAAVLADGRSLSESELRDWCKVRLSKYKIPKRLLTVDSLPRNAMGKVTKPDVTKLF